MIAKSLQLFSVALFCALLSPARGAELKTGDVAALTFADVDGKQLSTADGHVTIITVITRDNEANAHAVADQVPDRYLGLPKYRYVTLVNFQGKLPGILQGVTRSVIRSRLDAEAKSLRPQCAAKQIGHDPRRDLYVVADFDGTAVGKLGLAPANAEVAVFVFNGKGKLVQRWQGVPPNNSLGKAILAAE